MLDRNSCAVIETVVRANETDPYRIAHHSTYLVWAETALRKLLKETFGGIPDYNVTGFECKYKASAMIDEKLTVRIWFKAQKPGNEFVFRFDVRSDGSRELTVGEMCVEMQL